MLTTNIWWIVSKKCSYGPTKHIILHIFCDAIQQNINKKATHFCHANLEKIVDKTVTWIIYYKDYS